MSNLQNKLILKQIFLSPQISSHQNIITIADKINSLSQQKKEVKIIARSLKNDEQYDLRLKLLIQTYSMRTGKEVCEKWVLCEVEEYVRGEVEGSWTGIVILDWSDIPIKNQIIYKSNIFVVRSLSQALVIVSLQKQERKKRQKLEMMLRKSQIKFENNCHLHNFRKIVQNLMSKRIKSFIQYLSKSLGWSGRFRIRQLRRYFNQWLISHYKSLIEKRQEQIIQGSYLIQKSNRKMMMKYFNAWKSLRFSAKYSLI